MNAVTATAVRRTSPRTSAGTRRLGGRCTGASRVVIGDCARTIPCRTRPTVRSRCGFRRVSREGNVTVKARNFELTLTYEHLQSMKRRFASKVRVDYATGCWVWTAGTTSDGYGHFYMSTDGARRIVVRAD